MKLRDEILLKQKVFIKDDNFEKNRKSEDSKDVWREAVRSKNSEELIDMLW